MRLIPRHYLALLSNRDFFLLISIIFIGQLATSFLMLSLVVSVFAKTGSNFGDSGVVLSFTIPRFLFIAVVGLFTAAVVHLFFGNQVTWVFCGILLLIAAMLSVLLPYLLPQKSRDHSIA